MVSKPIIDEIISTTNSIIETYKTSEISSFSSTLSEVATDKSSTANPILEENNTAIKENKFIVYIVLSSIFAILIASIIIYFVIKISKRKPIDSMNVEMHNTFYKNNAYMDEI